LGPSTALDAADILRAQSLRKRWHQPARGFRREELNFPAPLANHVADER